MRSCVPIILSAIVTVAAPTPAAGAARPAEPAPTEPVRVAPTPAGPAPPIEGGLAFIARYEFNPSPGPLTDGSGNGHTLRVLSVGGGQVHPVPHAPGTALAFPPRCSGVTCPRVALQSSPSAALNPGARNFAFGADVLLAPSQTSLGQNVLQKGYSGGGSQYKLQIDGTGGRPSCVLVDDRRPGIRIARSAIGAADGRWHRIRCQRLGTRLEVFVDGVRHGGTGVPATLSISNDRPLSIGAKGACRDNDQFNGALDNVWVWVG